METFGDTAAGVWLGEVINNCFRETGEDSAQVDMNLLMHLCKREPKNAQVAMQVLAQELRTELKGRPVSEASGMGLTHRLLVGCIYSAYCLAREVVGRVPLELEMIVKFNPEILECAVFVANSNEENIRNLDRANASVRKPWWKRW